MQWSSVPITYLEQLLGSSQHETSKKPVIDTLTPREQDVLQLLASGASNIDIAKKLNLSAGTVRVYLSAIYSKLDVTSRTQAVLLVKDLEI